VLSVDDIAVEVDANSLMSLLPLTGFYVGLVSPPNTGLRRSLTYDFDVPGIITLTQA
jgi:hypothetical protein